ncbi:unnamed protein product [Rotaria sp. Silwood1]|nr:unnamed protein product [Rotaria sp. Silwood1]
MAPQQDNGSMKIQYVLTKTKDAVLHIINYEDLIFHRNKNKLKVGDEVSWNGKTRNDRGRGKIIVLGTKDQCEATKTVIEETLPSSESSSTLPSSSSTSLPVPLAAVVRKGATKRLAIDDDDNHSCDSSSTKRKVVHVGGDKSKKVPRADVSTAAPIISSTISFVTRTSSIPEVANTAHILKDMDCSSDSNSEKELIIDEQIVDGRDDDDVQTDNNNSTILKDNSTHMQASCNETKVQNIHPSKTSKSFRALPVKKPVSDTAHSLLKQQCQRYSDQIDCYKTTWMPRPRDPKTIKFFVEMGRLLSGDTDPNSSDKSSEEGIGDALADYCSLLSIDESQIDIFSRCDSITKACRTIVSHLYSKEERIGMAWKNVPVKKQNAILDMARLLNPLERGRSDGELIKACRNVFEAANCCKRKLEQVDRMELASMMKSLNEGSDDNISRSASTDLIPDVDMTSASNNQNQNMTSIPAVPEGSILDDAIRQIENSSNNSGRRVEAIDISAALLILKARHRLSNRCLSDILKLLRILRVANVPTSLWKSRKLVNTQSNSHLHMKKQSICPSCKDTSSEVNRCTKCHITYQTILTTSSISIFYHFDIGSQLESILLHTPDLVFQNFLSPPSKRMRDIVDGVFYRNQLKQETDLFITLTMNVDGVQPNKGSDSSIWPVLIVVNEIRRRKRYSLENVILAGVWPGPKKPSRDDMAIFLKGIVNELKCLEAGRKFQLRSTDGESVEEAFIKVFLVSSCCDKPAQCLVQCLAQPTAKFGCGKCAIRGETVETEGGGHVTSFIINADETINPRSNDQYNELLETMKLNNEELASLTTDRDIKAAKLRHTESQMGLKGPCCLRELKYFDFGQSFVVDSLHNIYLGAFSDPDFNGLST